jgi:hypothetical protein
MGRDNFSLSYQLHIIREITITIRALTRILNLRNWKSISVPDFFHPPKTSKQALNIYIEVLGGAAPEKCFNLKKIGPQERV